MMPAERDLHALSESFSDMVKQYTTYVETAGRELVKKTVLGQLPDGTPDALEDQLFDYLSALADATIPDAPKRTAKRSEKRLVTYFLQNHGERALKLKAAAESTGVDVRRSKLRLVIADITYDEIDCNPFSWTGTIVQARIQRSTMIVPGIEDRDYFVVYAPEGCRPPKDTPVFKIVKSRTKRSS